MAVAALNMSGHTQSQLTRGLDRILEEAQLSGELKLSGRKLKDFPKIAVKYNLSDTVFADLSKNRFNELPFEVTDFCSLERLDLYHNAVRTIPETVILLHSLTHLDLSRNQLSILPSSLCQLPLQVLSVSNNRLVSLPEDLERMVQLMELDVSCNQLGHLPPRMGRLEALRSLNLRRNLLVHLPVEVAHLNLVKLDISGNRITTLPLELRRMTSLEDFDVNDNPLQLPPAHLCTRGRVHVFKYLEIQAIQEDRKRAVLNDELRQNYKKHNHSDLRCTNGFSTDRRRKKMTVDSGYGTTDGLDRWSQELADITDPEEAHRLAVKAAELAREQRRMLSPKWYSLDEGGTTPVTTPGSTPASSHRASFSDHTTNGTCSGSSTPSTLSPGNSVNLEEELARSLSKERLLCEDQIPQKVVAHLRDSGAKIGDTSHIRYVTGGSSKSAGLHNGTGHSSPDLIPSYNNLSPLLEDKRQFTHPQTYREYKEALRQQRAMENGGSVYRSRTVGDGISDPTFKGDLSKGDISQIPRPSPPGAASTYKMEPEDEFRIKHKAMVHQHRKEAHFLQRWLDEERKRLEMKNVQKEAVLSYVKSRTNSRGESPDHSPVGNGVVIINGDSPPSPLSTSSSNSSIPNGNSSPHFNASPKVSFAPQNNVISSRQNGGPPSSAGSYASLPNRRPSRIKSPFLVTPPGGNSPVNLNFTMRREMDKAREEAEQVEMLRQNIESRLKVSLPDELSIALMDGVVLCHLANHVRPRSVASIHVPSPAVPKLTMAKCRRNVENFLDACRRIGVEEMLLCTPADILESNRLIRVAITVSSLLNFHPGKVTPTSTLQGPITAQSVV